MINLEDINTKENLMQDFYAWLFDDKNIVDKSVNLEKEVDISLDIIQIHIFTIQNK